jgi:hypothetical protein
MGKFCVPHTTNSSLNFRVVQVGESGVVRMSLGTSVQQDYTAFSESWVTAYCISMQFMQECEIISLPSTSLQPDLSIISNPFTSFQVLLPLSFPSSDIGIRSLECHPQPPQSPGLPPSAASHAETLASAHKHIRKAKGDSGRNVRRGFSAAVG